MKKQIFIIFVICGLVLPIFAWAGILSGPLVPCGREGQAPCTLCDIFKLTQNIINFILVAIFVIAPIFIIVGGIIMLTSAGEPDKVSRGKKAITSAIFGLIIALLSWVIINTVMNALAKEPGQPGAVPWPWNKIECVGGEAGPPEPPSGDRCSQMSAAGYCFSNNYYCLTGIRDQVPYADSNLVNLLNCMADRLPSGNARDISSITDNSGGRCITNWTSPQCSGGTDSCTGTCCGHGQNSLHYGGAGCRGFSYAIDFATESAETFIRNAANVCATSLGLGSLDIINEGNHIHVELDGLARQRFCI